MRVTDWRRVDGRGVAFQVVLERGTTVLVDHYGLPRVRCLSGDPLGLPDRVLQSARFVGTPWSRFEPATVIAIAPAPAVVPTLVLLDVSTGRPFGRPVGGDVRTDIDTDTLVADQAKLGVTLTLAAPQAPDQVQDLQLSPWGGPPGTTVLAFGTGWPAGDRLLIEPCVGDRPETCALRTDVAVFTVAGPDGSFRAVELRVPGNVNLGDYVEFYVQDTREDHRGRTFDSPWTVAARDCRDDCAEVAGCHPPFCGGGGGGDQAQDRHDHGCRCMVRSAPVCQIDGCGGGGCPKDSCVQAFREEPAATPRPHPSGSSGQSSKATGSGHGQGGQQTGGQGSSTHTSNVTTAESATTAQATSGHTTQSQTTRGGHTQTSNQPPPPTHSTQTTRSQTTQTSSAPPQTTHSTTRSTSSSQTTHSQPTPHPTPPSSPTPAPTPAHTPAHTAAPTAAPTPAGSPPPGPSQHPGPPPHH